MAYLIDFDDPHTFPEELRKWDIALSRKIQYIMNESPAQIHDTNLENLNLQYEDLISNFVENHPDIEVVLYHCTRILNPNEFLRNGIVTGNGAGSVAEQRIKTLLLKIGLKKPEIDEILLHVHSYWNKNPKTRTNVVHFFCGKNLVYTNDGINAYALNLGGEILRWSLEGIDKELYKAEPYKRLWIRGTPSIIKFKCKLCNIDQSDKSKLIAEIVKYYIMKDFDNTSYNIEFTGKTNGPIPPEDIIGIEEIKNFIKIQEKYPDFQHFYEELM